MNKQPDKVFALYYRAARTNDNDTPCTLTIKRIKFPFFRKGVR